MPRFIIKSWIYPEGEKTENWSEICVTYYFTNIKSGYWHLIFFIQRVKATVGILQMKC